jgi:spermidine synthase
VGIVARDLHDNYNVEIDTVEISENIINMARKYFYFEKDGPYGKSHIQDATKFVKETEIRDRYDFIIHDMYAGKNISYNITR